MEEKFIRPFSESKEYSDKFVQSFDKEKITITMAGKTFNMYDYIQAGREDTEIYPTLKKYGNIQKLERPAEDIYQDLSETLNLRDILKQDESFENIFMNLPLEERKLFDNNIFLFKEVGLKYYENKKNDIDKKIEELIKENRNKNTAEGDK